MNKEAIKPPAFLVSQMQFGEYVVFHCKPHKGIWVVPILLLIIFISFSISYPAKSTDYLAYDIFIFLELFGWFLISFCIYIGTDLVLTNKRVIVKKFLRTHYIKLEEMGAISSNTLMSDFQNMGSGSTWSAYALVRINNFVANLFGILFFNEIFLDLVSVYIIEKNGSINSKMKAIYRLDYEKLRKLFAKESIPYSDF